MGYTFVVMHLHRCRVGKLYETETAFNVIYLVCHSICKCLCITFAFVNRIYMGRIFWMMKSSFTLRSWSWSNVRSFTGTSNNTIEFLSFFCEKHDEYHQWLCNDLIYKPSRKANKPGVEGQRSFCHSVSESNKQIRLEVLRFQQGQVSHLLSGNTACKIMIHNWNQVLRQVDIKLHVGSTL